MSDEIIYHDLIDEAASELDEQGRHTLAMEIRAMERAYKASRAEVALCHSGMNALIRERDALRADLDASEQRNTDAYAEMAGLRAEVERLRAFVREVNEAPTAVHKYRPPGSDYMYDYRGHESNEHLEFIARPRRMEGV